MTDILADMDERFAEFLRGAVERTPVPAAPREEMWAAIAQRRRGAPALVVAGTQNVVPLSERRGRVAARGTLIGIRAVPMQWAVPLAAAFLFVGIGIGVVADNARTGQNGAVVADANAPAQQIGGNALAVTEPTSAMLASSVANLEYFKDAQKLLADFETVNQQKSEVSVDANRALSMWASQLLGATQTMLDDPAFDGGTRRLLVDMERVLAQMAQLQTDGPEFVKQDIENARLLQRLQSSNPKLLQQGI